MLLLSCDDYIYSFNGEYYVREFGHDLIYQYLNIFHKIKVVARIVIVKGIADLGSYNIKLYDDRITIVEFPFFRGVVQFIRCLSSCCRVASSSVGDVDVAVFRLPSTTAFCVWYFLSKKKINYAVEIVANPHDLCMMSKNLLNKFALFVIDRVLKNVCKKAIGIS